MNLSKNHNFKLESHEKEEGKENLERERGGGGDTWTEVTLSGG